jgi:hypothetical protein
MGCRVTAESGERKSHRFARDQRSDLLGAIAFERIEDLEVSMSASRSCSPAAASAVTRASRRRASARQWRASPSSQCGT